jgi:hypothetical protein
MQLTEKDIVKQIRKKKDITPPIRNRRGRHRLFYLNLRARMKLILAHDNDLGGKEEEMI